MIYPLILSICFIGLAIGTYTDFRTREVPDWLNYSLIISGIGIRLVFSAAWQDWSILAEGVTGLLVFVAVAYLMFYSGQWGGGDSKMIMGLGALLGLRFDVSHIMVSFFINMLIAGSVFGILYSSGAAIKNFAAFRKRALKLLRKYTAFRRLSLLISVILLFFALFIIDGIPGRVIAAVFAAMMPAVYYMWVFVKAVEDSCMIKRVDIGKITEGDWIPEDVKIGGRRICGPGDLGISMEQIKKLAYYRKKGKITKVRVKYGMPFVAAFFAAFIMTVIWGNLLFAFF